MWSMHIIGAIIFVVLSEVVKIQQIVRLVVSLTMVSNQQTNIPRHKGDSQSPISSQIRR